MMSKNSLKVGDIFLWIKDCSGIYRIVGYYEGSQLPYLLETIWHPDFEFGVAQERSRWWGNNKS